jgi:hypothetical protein
MGLAYGATQTIFCFGYRYEMNMVSHQAVCPDLYFTPVTPLGHQGEIFSVIGSGKKGIHTPIAALGNVMGYSGNNYSCNTCHIFYKILWAR